MENRAGSKIVFIKAAAVIIAVTAAVYANSLKNPFVWDDAVVVERNDFVRSGKNLPALFSPAYLTALRDIGSTDFYSGTGSGETSYRPVTTATYFFDYRLWKLNPWGWHLTNLILHAVNAILVFIFAGLLTRDYRISLFASLFFALHPVNAEAVGIISFREDLLVFLFYLSSLILYIKAQAASCRRKNAALYGLSFFSFILALFSKEMAVTLPLILILYDYYFTPGWSVKNALTGFRRKYAGYFIALLFYAVIAFWAIGYNAATADGNSVAGFFSRLLTAPKVFTVYLQWLFFPFNIHVTLPEYPLSSGSPVLLPVLLFSSGILALAIIFAFNVRRASPVISFAVFWFFITLLPVANIIPITNYLACRYLYIPAAGFCLFAAALMFKPQVKKFSGYAAFLVIAVYFMLTPLRNAVWQDDVSLWSEMAAYYPRRPIARSGLAGALRKAGRLDEAIKEYKIALKLDPFYASDHNNLGICYYEKKMFGRATAEFQKALKLDPGLFVAYSNLGNVLGEQGMYGAALAYFKRAISMSPRYIPAYDGLAVTYARLGKFNVAGQLWEKALEIRPDDPALRGNIAKLKRLIPDGSDAPGKGKDALH